jgi:hypothetical protein
MDHQHIAAVLQQAWQQKEYPLLESVLANGVLEWYEDPFEEALTSRETVVQRWEHDVAKQSQLHVTVQVLDAVAERGYYSSQASWVDETGKSRIIDGVFVVRLDDSGRIAYFNQWWSAKT